MVNYISPIVEEEEEDRPHPPLAPSPNLGEGKSFSPKVGEGWLWDSLISLRPLSALFALSALSTDPSAFGTSPTSGEEWSDGSGYKNVTREEGGSLQGLGY